MDHKKDKAKTSKDPAAATPGNAPATQPTVANQAATAGTVRVPLPNIDAIVEQPPRRRSSILATNSPNALDLQRIGRVVDAKDPKEREYRFIAKCRACCNVYDLADMARDITAKELKRATLQELCDLLRSTRGLLTEALYPEIIHLVAINAFRALPPLNQNIIPEFDPVAEAEEPTLEVAWPHLQLVYNVFLNMLESSDFNAQLAVRYIDHTFVIQLLNLFDSEDPRERDLLKAIVHRMYGKFLMLRTYIRKQFNHIFYRVIYEVGRHHGLAEILEILGSIINGFAVPLREEHRVFLFKVLLPLHKVAGLVQFHPQLAYCTVQYLEKEPGLTTDLLLLFLRFWPKTDGAKEVMFLNELEELLDVMEPEQFSKVMVPVFRQIAKSAASPHFQIGERALFFFGNDYILGLLKDHAAVLYPILYPVLFKITTGHWNRSIHSLAYHALKVMMDMDQRMFDLCILNHSSKQTDERDMAEKRRHFDLMVSLHKAAEKSPLFRALAPSLRIRPPDMEDYLDARNISMKYENWKVTAEELKAREAQTQSHRPSSDKNDVLGIRRRSLSSAPSIMPQPPAAPATVSAQTSKSVGNVPSNRSLSTVKGTASTSSTSSKTGEGLSAGTRKKKSI
ncbi:serine/threonine-protein phosphatase 2A 56 kDa regulatory subunit epsilon isoform-like [Paramacrobiotus metropolitanus]|uniref:serine/threonine-protein phosphatase 2A 56 kDa regulatory subunit epsilon isoform-like n=1 Tax=Paramacrobiotus metropolitanus TaxID=2943436 RepID=UPI00244656D4|nr:serine/threonine-protein phosphatase 2A 56 kDa regulatory subunit epsilon isoform-like [Paramacrobiotus metropolitanus]